MKNGIAGRPVPPATAFYRIPAHYTQSKIKNRKYRAVYKDRNGLCTEMTGKCHNVHIPFPAKFYITNGIFL